MGCTPHGLYSVIIADHYNDALRLIDIETDQVSTLTEVARPQHAASKNSTHLYVTSGTIDLRMLLIVSNDETAWTQQNVAELDEETYVS